MKIERGIKISVFFILLLSYYVVSESKDETATSSLQWNIGGGIGMRKINFKFDFNGLNQSYSTGNTAGINLYIQNYLNHAVGISASIYQEWSGRESIIGANESNELELGTYSSEGSSGFWAMGIYSEVTKGIQLEIDIGWMPLVLHPSDIIANDFNGGSLGICPKIKIGLPKESEHAATLTLYYGRTILGNFHGTFIGGSLNYEYRNE